MDGPERLITLDEVMEGKAMDPDAALARIRILTHREETAEGLSEDETQELCELVDGLDTWLSRGGFKPADWT